MSGTARSLGIAVLFLANPVVMPVAIGQVAGLVELYANVSPSDTEDFVVIDAAGIKSTVPFSIPAGSLLVVTDAIITPNAIDGPYAGNLDNAGGNENRIRFRFDSTRQGMLHLQLASGIAFTTSPKAFGSAANPGAFVIRLLGRVVCTNPRLCVVAAINEPPISIGP